MNKEELALASREPSGESRRDASAQLKKQACPELCRRIAELIEMERRSCSMDNCTPEYICRLMGGKVPLEEIVEAMKEM